jgi:hypothetical protein
MKITFLMRKIPKIITVTVIQTMIPVHLPQNQEEIPILIVKKVIERKKNHLYLLTNRMKKVDKE